MGFESKKTSSCHTTEAETGKHSFKIVSYSLNKGIGVSKFIRSGTFTVGGYDWAIRFYPDGVDDNNIEYVSVYLELMSRNAEVRASYGLSLFNQNTGLSESVCSEFSTRVFNSKGSSFSPGTLIPRSSKLELKSAGYVVDNCLTIECTVTVIKGSKVFNTTSDLEIKVPPSHLSDHFGKLLLDEEGADVTFSVGGENFRAHKIVLATRSPVFKAQLYGPMKERRARRVTVEDMQPDVFKALLHFIYTDSRPAWEDLEGHEYYEINKHLLVAADRYAMDRLKLLCASTLVEYLGVETVASTLALADQHSCDRLKDVCIEFMASSGKMAAVVATQGYANLKKTCPSILVDVLEKSSNYHKK
ncbi:hypothetical protein ACP70R_003323 [Stipagrostis hirtigluma subsp. patula]